MNECEYLDLKTRREIYNFITQQPGLHLDEISKKMNIPQDSINYHLGYLKKLGVLIEIPDDEYVRYYIAKKISEREREMLHLLRQDVPLKIIMFLLMNPEASWMNISRHLKRHPKTISFHLKKLIAADAIETIPNGREIRYAVKNEEDIFYLLNEYGEEFSDDKGNHLEIL